jgi:GTP-binding protein
MLNTAKHLLTESDAFKIEQSLAEVAFVGRSNAGKSTLINALCQKNNMAFVSKLPGKTRTINVYEVRLDRWIVDLPGYGFAVGQKSERAQLGHIIEGYLTSRKNLRMVFIIIDVLVGPTKLDLLMINWMAHHKCPFQIIVNKLDKLSPVRLPERQKEISAQR